MDNKAQASMEYLLIIGGAILVAVIVMTIIFGMLGGFQGQAEEKGSELGATIANCNAGQNGEYNSDLKCCVLKSNTDTCCKDISSRTSDCSLKNN